MSLFAKAVKISALSQQRAREGHAPLLRQVAEMVALRLLRGVGPGYYHTAGFWRTGLLWRDKTGQMSAKEYRRFLARWNDPAYRKMSQHKIAEKAMLSLFNLPTPRFLGRIGREAGLDHRGRPLRDADDLAALLLQERIDRVVFKEVEGYGG
jgi:hypothetical protein